MTENVKKYLSIFFCGFDMHCVNPVFENKFGICPCRRVAGCGGLF